MLQAYHQQLATILLKYHIGRIVLGSMCVGDSVWLFGVVSVLQAYHQELATILLNYHIGRIVLGSIFVGVSVWLADRGSTVVKVLCYKSEGR